MVVVDSDLGAVLLLVCGRYTTTAEYLSIAALLVQLERQKINKVIIAMVSRKRMAAKLVIIGAKRKNYENLNHKLIRRD